MNELKTIGGQVMAGFFFTVGAVICLVIAHHFFHVGING